MQFVCSVKLSAESSISPFPSGYRVLGRCTFIMEFQGIFAVNRIKCLFFQYFSNLPPSSFFHTSTPFVMKFFFLNLEIVCLSWLWVHFQACSCQLYLNSEFDYCNIRRQYYSNFMLKENLQLMLIRFISLPFFLILQSSTQTVTF